MSVHGCNKHWTSTVTCTNGRSTGATCHNRHARYTNRRPLLPEQGFYLVSWKDDAKNEAAIKEDCKATIRCYPLELNTPEMLAGRKCFYSGEPATHIALFARAF